jgi:hypothetical protein
MVGGYVSKSTVRGMGFTLLIFALTIQNYFIFRAFWNKVAVNDPGSVQTFDGSVYNRITYLNIG